ncbi:hypothetical protein ACFVH6_21800 [Spirillospora sp. NPDC127200]
MKIGMKIGRSAKAIVAAAAAGAGTLASVLDDDVITSGEWVMVALAVLGALGITWAVPNAAVSDRPAPPHV